VPYADLRQACSEQARCADDMASPIQSGQARRIFPFSPPVESWSADAIKHSGILYYGLGSLNNHR